MEYIENVEDKLNFREPREFGDLISTPFSYFFKNFKEIVFPILKYAGPIILIGMIFISLIIGKLINSVNLNLVNSSIDEFWYYFNYALITILLLGLGYIMAIAILYSHIVLTEEKGKGNFEDFEVKDLAFSIYFNLIIVQIIKLVLVILGLLVFIIGAIYVSIALTYVDYIIVKEKASPIEAIRRSFSVIKENWWKTFGILFIIQMILSVAMQILSVPLIIISAAMGFSGFENEYIIIIILVLSILTAVFTIITYTIPNIAISYLYYSIEENNINPNLIDRIHNISGYNSNNQKNNNIGGNLNRF